MIAMKKISIIFTILLSALAINSNAQLLMQDGSFSTCSETFQDPGGNSDYSTSQDFEMTICPDAAGQAISVDFTMFDTENNYDKLTIYDGNSTASSLIGIYDGNDLQGVTIGSTSGDGCLTFVWHSDGSVTYPGWDATISCTAGCQAIDIVTTENGNAISGNISTCMNTQIDFVSTISFPNNDLNYHQDITECTFLWDFGNGTTATTQNASVTYTTQGTYSVIYTVTDVNNCPTTVTYIVDVTCGGACAPCTDIQIDDPDANTCTGTFWDTGMSSDYSSNEDEEITICPDAPGQAVNVDFTLFDTESCCDHLWIYNGNSTAAPMITGLGGSTDDDYDGTELQGITVTSTSGDGCLTFVWHSDGSVTHDGWTGGLFCSPGCNGIDITSTANGNPIAGNVTSCIGEQINFVSTVTFPNNDLNYHQDITECTFLWDFGNGTTATTQDASVTYNTQGTYTVTYTVTDVNDCSTIETYTVDVTCGGSCPVCTDILMPDPDVNTCVGTFWDSGMTGDYSVPEQDTITICSDNGGFIQFHFNEFALENSSWSDDDKLIVYDGPDVNSPQLGVYNNGTPIPTDIISSGTCFTFVFHGDQWSTPGSGWSAEISCANPCQEYELNITSTPTPDDNGIIHACPGQAVDFTAAPTYPNNDTDYHQDDATTSITWTCSNGATGTGLTFNLPTDSTFNAFVAVDAVDINGCHVYDTLTFVSECQAVDVSFTTDATNEQNGEIFLTDTSIPLALDGSFGFPENGDCYTQVTGEYTWTFGYTDGNGGDLISSHAEDTVITFPLNGVYEIVLHVEDQEGCFNETSVEVHVGCQPVDVTWTGTPAMLGDTIIVCPGDSFHLSIFTDYFANDILYHQDDALSTFNWNMADGTLILDQMDPGNYAFAASGLYSVNVQIFDTMGCVDNTTIPVLSFMEPSLAGTHMSADTICYGDSLILFGNTTVDMPSYSAPPVFLPDGQGFAFTSTLTFDMFGDAILTDVNDFMSVCLNLEHSYTGDLRIHLICPNGQTVELLPYPNGLGGHFLGEPVDNDGSNTYGVGYEYCFTPDATQSFQDVNGLYTYTFTDNDGTTYTDHSHIPAGDYAPTGTFDDLIGCPLNGDWVIEVTDNIGSDNGMLFDWSITLNQDEFLPPDTLQLPFNNREWTVASGGPVNISPFYFEDDCYATPLDTGLFTFTFTTTSPAGCSYDTTIGPLYVAPMPQWTLGNDTNLCSSYDYTIPGTLSDGTGTWSYVGPGTAVFSDINNIPTDVTVDTYGDYRFYFTPNTIAFCANPDSILISFHELPTVDNIIDSLTCYQSCDGQISLTETGTELPYRFAWSTTNLADTNATVSSLCGGNYVVTVSTDYCSNTFNYLVPEPDELVIVDSGKVDNLCFEDNNGQVWVSVEGGTPGYSYTWSPINIDDSLITDLADGLYQVTVTDHNGCSTTASQIVNGPSGPLVIESIVATDIACFGEASGELDITVTGGTVPYSYLWLHPDGSTSSPADPTGLYSGIHYVTVTDANGCDTIGNQVITEPTEMQVVTHVEPTSCYDYLDGKAWVEPSQATPPYTYEWSTEPIWTDSVLINVHADEYTVTITDSRGCTKIRTLEVEQPDQVMFSVLPTSTLCIGENTDLTMSVTSSPFAPYSYYWNGILSTATINVNPPVTTTYSAQVIDAHGCESLIVHPVVNVFDPITAVTTPDNPEICEGELVNVTVEAQGGNGNYTYTLGSGLIVSDSFTVQPEQTQDYTVIVSDDCTTPPDTNQFNVEVWGIYVPSFHADRKNGCSPLTVNFYQDIQSHDEGTTYLWSFGDGSSSSISFDPTPTHIFNVAGTYDIALEITTPKGCKSEKIEYSYITSYPVPTASFTSHPSVTSIIDPKIYFENNSIGGDAWYWNFGDGDTTFAWNVEHRYSPVMNDYDVTLVAISNYGCKDSITGRVKIVEEVTFHIPTAFSPDGDGKNEVFRPYGNALSDEGYSMTIYDRWGEVVFESTNINEGWDGKIKGNRKGTTGMYSYIIRFIDVYGVPHERSGYVNLIR